MRTQAKAEASAAGAAAAAAGAEERPPWRRLWSVVEGMHSARWRGGAPLCFLAFYATHLMKNRGHSPLRSASFVVKQQDWARSNQRAVVQCQVYRYLFTPELNGNFSLFGCCCLFVCLLLFVGCYGLWESSVLVNYCWWWLRRDFVNRDVPVKGMHAWLQTCIQMFRYNGLVANEEIVAFLLVGWVGCCTCFLLF